MKLAESTEHLHRRPGVRETAIKVLRFVNLNRVAARIYYRHFHGFESASDEMSAVIRRCFRRAVEMDTASKGDYYEFGVFKGYAFWQSQLAAQELDIKNMHFFGFDSFAGLPPINGVDDTADAPFYEGQYAWPLEQVTAELDNRGVDWKRCSLIEGYFDTTLNEETRLKHKMRKASIVLLDSDLYESAIVALEFLQDSFIDGSILIMDDWNAFDADDSRGERLALAEFEAKYSRWKAEPWFPYGLYGQVFIMHRTDTQLA